MRLLKITVYEFLLVLASVLLFRSLWMIADRISWMNRDAGILGSLIVGIGITLISLIRLNIILDEKREE
jgi:nicotinamide riboside transporter PnuC